MRLAGILLLWLAGWLLPGWVVAADLVPLPELKARVTDLTGTLSPEQGSRLESKLQAIEAKKGSQVVVLLLPTTQPESIEAFGIRLAEAWKVGRRGVNDGVIIVVAKNDHRMRIEVGYGLEGAIPDAIAKRIVAESMAPKFRQGDYAGGLIAAVQVLESVIGGEPLPAAAASTTGASGDINPDDKDLVYLFALSILAVLFRTLLGLVGLVLVAALAGWLAWVVFSSWLAVAVAVAVTFLAGLILGSRHGWSGGYSGSGGFSGGGGSSSGGGFSGGGGSFGGGGASGDW